MSNAPPVLHPDPVPAPGGDDLGIDRAFVLHLARMPVFAVLWVGAAVAAHQIWAAIRPEGLNGGPLLVIEALNLPKAKRDALIQSVFVENPAQAAKMSQGHREVAKEMYPDRLVPEAN